LAPSDIANAHNLKSILAKLAATDSDQYKDELATVEATYNQLVKNGATLPTGNHW
jgi:hypothetical protein